MAKSHNSHDCQVILMRACATAPGCIDGLGPRQMSRPLPLYDGNFCGGSWMTGVHMVENVGCNGIGAPARETMVDKTRK